MSRIPLSNQYSFDQSCIGGHPFDEIQHRKLPCLSCFLESPDSKYIYKRKRYVAILMFISFAVIIMVLFGIIIYQRSKLSTIDQLNSQIQVQKQKNQKMISEIQLLQTQINEYHNKITDLNISFQYLQDFVLKQTNLLQLKNLSLEGREINDTTIQVLTNLHLHLPQSFKLNKTSVNLQRLNNFMHSFYYQIPSPVSNITIQQNGLGDGLIDCLKWWDLSNLNSLVINAENITDETLKKLSTFTIAHINTIDLNYNRITDKGMQQFALSNSINKDFLTHFYIKSNNLGHQAFKNFTKLPQLIHLNLQSNKLQDSGLENLCKLSLPKLNTLNLIYNNIKNISSLPQFLMNSPSMRYLYLNSNPISQSDITNLRSQFSNIHIFASDI